LRDHFDGEDDLEERENTDAAYASIKEKSHELDDGKKMRMPEGWMCPPLSHIRKIFLRTWRLRRSVTLVTHSRKQHRNPKDCSLSRGAGQEEGEDEEIERAHRLIVAVCPSTQHPPSPYPSLVPSSSPSLSSSPFHLRAPLSSLQMTFPLM
jgi:hypothetical protein